jgi:hypothetical protein
MCCHHPPAASCCLHQEAVQPLCEVHKHTLLMADHALALSNWEVLTNPLLAHGPCQPALSIHSQQAYLKRCQPLPALLKLLTQLK